MIHDHQLAVACDRTGCNRALLLQPNYNYQKYNTESCGFDYKDSVIERKLNGEGWIVKDGKHYCGESCANGGESEG